MKIKKHDQLGKRDGLPKDLQKLLEKYPRDSWGEDVLNGNWVAFWLGRHSLFRKISTSINDIIEHKCINDIFVHIWLTTSYFEHVWTWSK